MYVYRGKTLAIFPAICYDEITLNSKENKVIYTKTLCLCREFRGIFG